jgi:hypothetical protein
MKNILLIAPTWVNLHKDIIVGLESLGFDVDFIPEYSFRGDPLRIKSKGSFKNSDEVDQIKTNYWKKCLNDKNAVYDYLFVIDGQGINHYIFSELKKRNANVFFVNYLYDTTYSMYHFEENFHFYHRILTFDITDASQHQITLLPIYWLESQSNDAKECKYDIFGLGAFSNNRYLLFNQVRIIANEMGKTNYIKLYTPSISNVFLHNLKNKIKLFMGRQDIIPAKLYKEEIITSELLSTEDFRCYVNMADVVLDTKVLNQTGLTARFMWALGAGKKIITTNDAIKLYDFYNPLQILIMEERTFTESDRQRVKNFINSKFVLTNERKKELEYYRLDNWLKTVLGL